MAGFYSANEHRSYPLVDADTGIPIPDAVAVDFGCVAGLRAGFVDAVHSIWLSRLARSGTTYTFEFSSDAPGMADRRLRFTRELDAPEYATEWVTDESTGPSSSSSASDASEDCVDDPVMEAFLVTGLLAELPGLLADGEELTDAAALTKVEPCLIQNLAKTFVRSVNLGNKDRVRVEDAAGCGPDGNPVEVVSSSISASSVPEAEPEEEPASAPILVNAVCLFGALKLKEGFNCAIRVARSDNSVTISGQVGAGAGEACDEVPLYDGEPKPTGSTLYTGGPTCTEVLKSINGIGGRVIRLIAGDGVQIAPAEAPNTILLNVDLHGMALCVQPVSSSISEVPEASVSSSSSGGEP